MPITPGDFSVIGTAERGYAVLANTPHYRIIVAERIVDFDDARLFASAKLLLAACKLALQSLNACDADHWHHTQDARDAMNAAVDAAETAPF